MGRSTSVTDTPGDDCEGPDYLRQQRRGEKRRGTDAEMAAPPRTDAARPPHRPVEIAREALGILQELRRRLGEVHAAGRAVEEAEAEFSLQFPDEAGDHWLRHVQRLGGAGEVVGLGHGNEGAELAEGDAHRPAPTAFIVISYQLRCEGWLIG
ncbi:MAG TPA: hypothetical protein VIL69_08120 [Roseomonas sp.]|jgi:hypothetical protein